MSLRSTFRALWTFGKGVSAGLPDADASRDPIGLFKEWFEAARQSGLLLPESMTLATVSADGAPSARMVLLKGVDERGFVFFTNYESRKGRELGENPRAALVFHWAILERQVRVEGAVTRISAEESFAYFKTRTRGSRIGAWASRQSDPLEDTRVLKQQVETYRKQFEGGEVDLPPYWGGFRVVPARIEFWQGRANRLHDRLCFIREEEGWQTMRLYP